MSPNKVPLIIHCKSKNDDLGIHYLMVGDVFQFHFKINIWYTTLFWCHMTWGAKDTTIDVFRTGTIKESTLCQDSLKCSWYVKEDGFYFLGDDPPKTKKYGWR